MQINNISREQTHILVNHMILVALIKFFFHKTFQKYFDRFPYVVMCPYLRRSTTVTDPCVSILAWGPV